MRGPGNVEREMTTGKTVPKFQLSFAEFVLQLMSKIARKEIQNIIRLVFDASFDAGKLRRQVERLYDRKQILDSKRDEA